MSQGKYAHVCAAIVATVCFILFVAVCFFAVSYPMNPANQPPLLQPTTTKGGMR